MRACFPIFSRERRTYGLMRRYRELSLKGTSRASISLSDLHAARFDFAPHLGARKLPCLLSYYDLRARPYSSADNLRISADLRAGTALHSRYLATGPQTRSGASSEDMAKALPDLDISLPEFLRLKKAAYMNDISAGKGDEWTVVMGNEAGDLDSLASAIAYAWYACNIKNSPTIPLVQAPRADLPLRAENLHALELVGIDQSDLLCIDDVPAPFPSSRFALMDHNRLTGPFTLPNARVTAIIDHHTDEGLYADSADPRIVVPGIGSCSSLVALELKERRALQLKEDRPKQEQAPSALATLLLAAIVIDTTGLKPGGKAVEADYNAAAYLAPLTALPGSTSVETQPFAAGELHASAEVRALNATLQAKKGAVAHLGTRDLLRRDYKEYTHASSGRDVRVGMASVPVGLHEWLSREGQRKFAAETQAWMDERGLHALGILTSFRDDTKLGKSGKGRGKREQAWVVREDDGGDGELAHKLFKGLIKSEELRLKDKTWVKAGMAEGGGFGAGVHVRVWKQKNADATRKVTAPLVRAILEAPGEGADSHKSGL